MQEDMGRAHGRDGRGAEPGRAGDPAFSFLEKGVCVWYVCEWDGVNKQTTRKGGVKKM